METHEISLKEVTPVDNEASITFGYMFMAFMSWLYNLRITYPNEEIVLAFMDITC